MAGPELEHERIVYRMILFHEPPLVEHLCDLIHLTNYFTCNLLCS